MADRVLFMGTPDFAVPSLQALVDSGYEMVGVVTQPDRPAGRGRQLTPPPVKRRALQLELPVLQPPTLRTAAAVSALDVLEPDVIVVAAYGLILPRDVLSIPRAGCLNVHASLLPTYRGAAPIPAAILAGDAETGVTIMLMDEGMDTGPILAQTTTPIRPIDTTASLSKRLARLGADTLIDMVPRWLAGTIVPRRQEESQASYAPMIQKSDRYIDWQLPAEQIDRQIRAYHPWPGSMTSWRGKPLKVISASVLPAGTASRPRGTVVEHPGGAAVVTGDGLLLLEEIQLAGKRPLPIEEFLHGHRGFIGSQLGSRSAP